MIEYDETMQFDEEMGATLIEDYHAPVELEVWEDFTMYRVAWSALRSAVADSGQEGERGEWAADWMLAEMQYFRCDSCHREDLLWTQRPAFNPEWHTAESWQVLVPAGWHRWNPSAIVNCPGCVVGR